MARTKAVTSLEDNFEVYEAVNDTEDIKEFVVKERVSDGRHIKHVYRELALVEPTNAEGAWYARDIEGYLDGLIEREGWYLESANVVGYVNASAHGGDKTEPVLRMLYILTK